ncbi:MAG: Thiol:disulfide interchange protein TlpA [Alphaproteobacteria bacterium MarineAlpha3_Bin7]|nr:MAG: Thiol:disulfide interchange protein TlpA [Alphaproteobacteria bacterium MarineAlpha3_Bin7]
MKTIINFIFIFLLLIKITTASSIANPIAQPTLNGQMKKFQLAKNKTSIVEFSWVDSSENQIKLSDFRGKVVLLNLWASWCAPCIRELPSLDRLAKDLDPKQFAIIVLSVDRGKNSIKKADFILNKKLALKNLKFYKDPKKLVGKLLGIRALPTTFLFDAAGRSIGKIEAAVEWDEKDPTKLIKFFRATPNFIDKLPER